MKKEVKEEKTKKTVKKKKEKVAKSDVSVRGANQLQTRQVLLILLMLLLVIGVCFGFTFAWIKMNEQKEKEEEDKIATLEVYMEGTDSSSFVIDDPFPMNETGGESTNPYKFTLINNGTRSVNYSLDLVEDTDAIAKCAEENGGTACKTITKNALLYSIKKDGGEFVNKGFVKDHLGGIDMGIVPAPTTPEGEKVEYELKIWVDYDTEEDCEGAKFFGKIEVKTMAGDE